MEIIELFSGLLTPVIAAVTTYIAIQQYRTNKLKFKLEVFDRRYAIYQGVKKFIYFAVREGNVSDGAIFELNEETQDAFFLFDKRVEGYVNELRSNGARLMYVNNKLADVNRLPMGDERSGLADEDATICTWFGNQLSESKKIFEKGLRVS
jgi:hypothetical protein